jgi:hypothetical protein
MDGYGDGVDGSLRTTCGCAALPPSAIRIFSRRRYSDGQRDLDTSLFAGYTKETASEEGLIAFVVDDITWWVCLEDISTTQEKRLRDIQRRNRLFVATSVYEMRHCPPETVVHDLIPKENVVWQIAKKSYQFAPLEMQWIRTYVG